MIQKTFLLLIVIFLSISCSKDDEINQEPDYVGFYKIENFKTENEVDLNNDGISNMNLKNEFKEYFSDSAYDLEVLIRNEEPKYTIRIKFPDWNLDSGTTETQDNAHIFYSSTLIAFYNIENGFEFIPKEWGENEELISGTFNKENKSISLVLKKRYFNFDSNQWEKLKISAEYKMVNP